MYLQLLHPFHSLKYSIKSTFIVCIIGFLFLTQTTNAQSDSTMFIQPDSTALEITADTILKAEKPKERLHSPRRATIYSMVLPGLGQAYNRKYWKIPIVYVGFGTLGYFFYHNSNEYNTFLDAYKYVVNEEIGDPPNEMVDRYNRDETKLRKIKNYHLRNLEITYIATGIFYILQVLDATVDAHFFYFDVSKDLSMKVSPAILTDYQQGFYPVSGVSLVFNLK